MARSEERTGIFGDVYTVNYNDDGEKTGESRNETTIFGTPYVEHRDAHGNKTGESRNETTIFGTPYVEHRDAHGNKTGESRNETTILGTPYVEHSDARGNTTGRSHEEKDWAGNRYKLHSGTAPFLQPSPRKTSSSHSKPSESSETNYSDSDWNSSDSGDNSQSSDISILGIAAFVIVTAAIVCVVAYASKPKSAAVPMPYFSQSTSAPVRNPTRQKPVTTDPSWQSPGTTESRLLDQAHAEIDLVYKTVLNSLSHVQQEVLRSEEREWIKWRDLEADRMARKTSVGGSAYRVDLLNAMISLVKQRTEYLRRYRPNHVVDHPGLGYIEPPPESAMRKMILDTVRGPAEAHFGQAVVFKVNRLRVSGLWAFFTGEAIRPDGSKVNYRKSKAYKNDPEGVHIGVDAGALYGGVDALLRTDGTGWKIVNLTFDAGDIYWQDFPQRFGCPKALFGD